MEPLDLGLGQCSEEVWEAPGYWHSHQCRRNATREFVHLDTGERRRVCTQHALRIERTADRIWRAA